MDVKKKVATRAGGWAGIAALATVVSHYIDDNLIGPYLGDGVPWHHVLAVIATAVVAGLVELAQQGTGPTVEVPDPDVPDEGGG